MLQAQAVDARGNPITFPKLFEHDARPNTYVNTSEIIQWLKDNSAVTYCIRPVKKREAQMTLNF